MDLFDCLVDFAILNVDAEISAFERMAERQEGFVDISEVIDLVLLGQRLLNWLGVDVKENGALDNACRFILNQNRDRVVYLLDHFPGRNEEPIRRQGDDEAIDLNQVVMLEDLRHRIKELIFSSEPHSQSAN